MNIHYKHSQTGWLGLILFPALVTGLAVAEIFFYEPRPESGQVLIFLIILFSVVTLMMYRLEVTVTDDKVLVRYGLAPVFPRFNLSEIVGVEVVRNPWWVGWGIRFAFHYWVYNVSGFDAVELTKSDGTRVRIGTDEPEKLAEAIRNRLEK